MVAYQQDQVVRRAPIASDTLSFNPPTSYCQMKKVNKQCLLDTPHTVRVSEKTWQVIEFKHEYLSFDKKISVESVQTKIINSFMHMFNVSTL